VAKNRYVVYCDGSAQPNPGHAGYGVVIESPDGSTQELSRYIGETTNNRAELTAVIVAMEALPVGAPVEICGDSQYVLEGIRSWRHGWKKRGWRKSNKTPVENPDLWKKIDDLVENHCGEVHTRHVRGHAGNELNELAHTLAVTAAMDRVVEEHAEYEVQGENVNRTTPPYRFVVGDVVFTEEHRAKIVSIYINPDNATRFLLDIELLLEDVVSDNGSTSSRNPTDSV